MEMLLSHKAKIDAIQENGRTALHIAASNGQFMAVKMLFSARPGLDPAPRDGRGVTPIATAAYHGELEIFKLLQEKKAHVEPDVNGWLPIHYAACYGHRAIVDLIPSAQNIEAETLFKRRPIHLAVIGGHLEIVKDLVSRGAFVDAPALDVDSSHHEPLICVTPLYLAFSMKNVGMIKYLLVQKVDMIGWRGLKNQSYLHIATRSLENESILRSLVEDFKLAVFLKDDDGETPLHWVALKGSLIGLEYIWTQNARKRMHIDDRDKDGWSVLHYAVAGSKYENAEYLLRQNANPNIANGDGLSPIFYASQQGDTQLLQLLIQSGANINVRGHIMDTPLGLAARAGKFLAIEVLVQNGAEVDIQDNTGTTPLQEAASRSHLSCFEKLVILNANPFRLNDLGFCALDYAQQSVSMRESPIVKELQKTYAPITADAKKVILKNTIVKHLLWLPKRKASGVRNWWVIWVMWLSDLLWPFELHAEAIGCFENVLRRTADGTFTSPFGCEKCGQIHGPYWHCRQCLATVICEQCYRRRNDGDIILGCDTSHDYLEIGGAGWQSLKRHTVDEDGTTFAEWLASISRLFEVDPDEAVLAQLGADMKEY